MNRDNLRKNLPALVTHVLPKNARQIRYSFFDNQPTNNALGMRMDPGPAEGTVVAQTDEAFIVKTDRTSFVAVDLTLATPRPAVGDKVRVTPYARRDFTGERLDAPKEEHHQTADGKSYTTRAVILGGGTAHIPLPAKPRCHYLAEMVKQMEILRTPDGLRTIANMLVDAHAGNIEIVDPDDENLIKTPPEISFEVSSAKFAGRIAVIYDRGHDLYVVELRSGGNVVTRIEDVDVMGLADVMADRIDDGQWRRIRVEILAPAKTPRSRTQPVACAA